MNPLKAVKVAELRSRLSVIPAKIILAVVITCVIFWKGDLSATLDRIAGDPLTSLKIFAVLYGVISYVYFFIRIFHNHLLGSIVAGLAAFAFYSIRDRFTEEQFNLIIMIMVFGGPVLDVLRFIRYQNMKREVIEESEGLRDKIDDIYTNVRGYDDGYDRGYSDGYDRGRSERIPERRNDRIEDRYYEEEYDDDGYEEEYEDSYDESGTSYGFFEGCKTPEAIKKRYRDLCKVYHPDSGNGSEAVFEAICEEYNRLMDE